HPARGRRDRPGRGARGRLRARGVAGLRRAPADPDGRRDGRLPHLRARDRAPRGHEPGRDDGRLGAAPLRPARAHLEPHHQRGEGRQSGGLRYFVEAPVHHRVGVSGSPVQHRVGYQNLVKLVSKAYLEGFYYKPRVDRELLAQHADGLVVLSGCLNSEVSRLLGQGETQKAKEIAGWYQEVVGRDYYFMEV